MCDLCGPEIKLPFIRKSMDNKAPLHICICKTLAVFNFACSGPPRPESKGNGLHGGHELYSEGQQTEAHIFQSTKQLNLLFLKQISNFLVRKSSTEILTARNTKKQYCTTLHS